MQEEILINRSRTGTTIYFFNTDINENNYSISTVPAVIKLSSSPESVPIELHAFDGVTLNNTNASTSLSNAFSTVLWKRNTKSNLNNPEIRMDYVYDTHLPNPNYITGRTYSQVLETPTTAARADALRNRFIASMNAMFTAGTTSYVFFEETLIDDLYANIKLERTFDILDNLNIYNKVTGEYINREATTGVVFGKLEAIQKISDANNQKVRIPLRNVPVGVFVPSTEFATPNDLDSNGNRLRLNCRPISVPKEVYATGYTSYYFNSESALLDSEFLSQAPLSGVSLHPTFSNVVYTDENGEFILHDINTGSQVLFFEVDLLKQGLTKDEVALNFFPYPPNFENVSIDTIPHYFYRAIPIDVVPSWGTAIQTGYTEVNISVNLDLRKWATYIIPPVTYSGLAIDTYSYQQISRAPLTVQVRDMSKFDITKISSGLGKDTSLSVYPSTKIQMVEIQNILDKNADQQWEWANEFSQIKDKAIFYNYGFHAVKLPANIYDSEGYRTDKFGEPQINSYSKGVWLCGYQLKIFLTKEFSLYRTTGMALTSTKDNDVNKTGWYDRDHFHCSLYDDIYTLSVNEPLSNSSIAAGQGVILRKFPYEKAWNKNYPVPYSIPKPPKKENYANYFSNERLYIESPRYADGDLIPGNSWLNNGNGWNGYGLSWFSNIEQYTDFATDIIGGAPNTDMYRYEPIGAGRYGQNQYFGCYVNGYYNNIPDVGASSEVVGAEEFQRVEAGYGYYLFPSSLPRLVPIPSGLFGYSPMQVDLIKNPKAGELGYSDVTEQSDNGWWNLKAMTNQYNSYSVLNRGKQISMDLAKKAVTKSLVNDKLNIYRIIEGTDKLSYDVKQPIVPTYTEFNIERTYFSMGPSIVDFYDVDQYQVKYISLKVTNQGDRSGGEKDTIITIFATDDEPLDYTTKLGIGESVTFYYSFQNTFIPSGTSVWTKFKNLRIKSSGNAKFDEVNNKYTKTALSFEINGVWLINNNETSVQVQVDKLHIRNNCANITGIFNAEDVITSTSTYYADTAWKWAGWKTNSNSPHYFSYYQGDNSGYPASNTWVDDPPYTEVTPRINGLFFNPGYGSIMVEFGDGATASYIYNDITNVSYTSYHLGEPSGSIAFYWSQSTRDQGIGFIDKYNSNGVKMPLASISSNGNFDFYGGRKACELKT